MAYLSTLSTLPAFYQLREGAPPDDLQWPLDFNIHDLFEIIYRAKEWKLTIGGTVTFEYETYLDEEPVTQTTTLNIGAEISIPSPEGMTEVNLTCSAPAWLNSPSLEEPVDMGTWSDTEDGYGQLHLGAAYLVFNGVNDAYVNGESYYPPMFFATHIVSDTLILDLSSMPALAGEHAPLNINFRDREWSNGHLAERGGIAPVLSSTLEVSLSISKWWPYDPEDGNGPIWSQSSGVQLRNPFTVQR